MITPTDRQWMQRAIALARSKGSTPADTPIAAIIVIDGRILAEQVNQTEEHKDATAHAEIMAIRAAGPVHGVTWTCAGPRFIPRSSHAACAPWRRSGRRLAGSFTAQAGTMCIACIFQDRHLDTMDFVHDAWRDDLVLEGGCETQLCASLYYRPQDDVPIQEQGNI